MKPADADLLRTFEPPRKIYVDLDPDWRRIETLWRNQYLIASKFDSDEGGMWELFSLSDKARKLLNSPRE